MRLLLAGSDSKEIADSLGLSMNTIKGFYSRQKHGEQFDNRKR